MQKKSNLLIHALFGWLTDKEKRALVAWTSTGFGSLMIGGYFLWLGFTPVFNLGQASLLLLQVILVGATLTIYLSLVILAPAWSYKLLDISPDDFPAQHRTAAIAMLTWRSIAAQTFATPLLFVLFMPSPLGPDSQVAIHWGIALNLTIFSGVSIALMPRTNELGRPESNSAYFLSIVTLGLFGIFGTTMLYMVREFAPIEQRSSDGVFFAAWATVTFVSAALSTLKKGQLPLGGTIALSTFIFLLNGLNITSMPFRGTAYAVGIAEPGLVTLILTPATCLQVKQTLSPATHLSCEGPNAGQLNEVQLMNTLGERWVFREKNSVDNISFEGKGTVVRKLHNNSK